jgi:hypothetical protein
MFEKTIIFNHKIHKSRVAAKRQISGLNPENKTCVICHSPGLPKDINSAVGCMECHNENMNVADTLNLPKQFLYANSYFDVMHKRCIVCHQERKQQVNKPNLDQCSNCHQNYYTNSKAKKELYSFITSD